MNKDQKPRSYLAVNNSLKCVSAPVKRTHACILSIPSIILQKACHCDLFHRQPSPDLQGGDPDLLLLSNPIVLCIKTLFLLCALPFNRLPAVPVTVVMARHKLNLLLYSMQAKQPLVPKYPPKKIRPFGAPKPVDEIEGFPGPSLQGSIPSPGIPAASPPLAVPGGANVSPAPVSPSPLGSASPNVIELLKDPTAVAVYSFDTSPAFLLICAELTLPLKSIPTSLITLQHWLARATL